jgi:ADP-ribose pyrophosphatase YjhB (NUDIX family)
MVKRRYPDHPVVGVGAVILRHSEILLVQRGNEPAIGQWTIPGGVVEVGESLDLALRRETKEETSLEVEEARLIDVVDQVHYDNARKIEYHYVIIDYAVNAKGEPKASSDAADLRWVGLDDVESYDLTPSFRRFFVKNKKRLKTGIC